MIQNVIFNIFLAYPSDFNEACYGDSTITDDVAPCQFLGPEPERKTFPIDLDLGCHFVHKVTNSCSLKFEPTLKSNYLVDAGFFLRELPSVEGSLLARKISVETRRNAHFLFQDQLHQQLEQRLDSSFCWQLSCLS